jgi:hypothetical protein
LNVLTPARDTRLGERHEDFQEESLSKRLSRAAGRQAAAIRRGGLLPQAMDWISRHRTLATAVNRAAPLLAIAIGLGVVVGITPIGSGDYGQWLMASRYYLGEEVPDYRSIDALPPVIPFSLAVLRFVISEPFVALHAFSILLLIGLVFGVYAVATAIFMHRAAGMVAVVLAFLVTDRFLELFAFGGLLQGGAILFTTLSVAAFVRAGAGPGIQRVWWSLGSVSLVLAALSHVGTGVLAVPVALSAAALSLVRIRHMGSARLLRALVPVALILVFFAPYLLLVLLPASQDYVTNPASLNYRGAGRLLDGLTSYWPTVIIMVVGGATIVLGGLSDLRRGVLGRYVLLLLWTGAVWGTLLIAILTGASTDYPRFTTPLLIPLVIGAAGGMYVSAKLLAAYLYRVHPRIRRRDWVFMSVTALAVTAAPFAVQRYQTLANGYELHDAEALTTVVSPLSDELDQNETVLAPVREAKWIEGLTGRAALFAQSVRYAFRPGEWDRSIAAEALLRSTSAIANEFFFVKFENLAVSDAEAVPRDVIVAANHGGEFVDLLRVSETRVMASDLTRSTLATLANLHPLAVSRTATTENVTIQTNWNGERRGAPISLIQDATLKRNSPTFDLVVEAQTVLPVEGLQIDMRPAPNINITRVVAAGQQAIVYFTRRGLEEPRIRLSVLGGSGRIELIEPDTLRLEATGSRLHVQVSILTAGEPFSRLRMLYPPQLVKEYNIAAILLNEDDPAFEARERRLAAIGFHTAAGDGPYRLMFGD